MGIGTGMRGKDLQKFLMVARDYKVILLVRHTNEDSLRYVGQLGYYPKPALVKAKTADLNPAPVTRSVNGRMVSQGYVISGLVVHPGMHPGAYRPAKLPKAMAAWEDGMHYLAGAMPASGDPNKPETWAAWGVGRTAACSAEWRWRVDVDPASKHYGCLQLSRANVEYERIRTALNQLIGADMVQHGAEAQFAWHGDEPITVAFPNWTFVVLNDAVTVQRWYEERNRSVLAKTGHDYVRDRSRMFHFGPQGMFAPGAVPSSSWG